MCQKRLSHLFGLEIKRDTLSNIIERYERSLFFSPNSVKTAFITTSTFFWDKNQSQRKVETIKLLDRWVSLKSLEICLRWQPWFLEGLSRTATNIRWLITLFYAFWRLLELWECAHSVFLCVCVTVRVISRAWDKSIRLINISYRKCLKKLNWCMPTSWLQSHSYFTQYQAIIIFLCFDNSPSH